MLKLIVIFLVILVGTPSGSVAVELLERTSDGKWTFICKRPGRVGKARVTLLKQGRYYVMGPWHRGLKKSENEVEAAKHACGEYRKEK